MFMTRAQLAPSSLGALLAQSAAQDGAHKLIWTLFSKTDSERDFLFRAAGEGTFIIVSKRPPEDSHRLWRMETKPYDPAIARTDRFGFVLRANPAMAARAPGARRGLRVDAVMHAKQPRSQRALAPPEDVAETAALEWLFKRGEKLGATFDTERCTAAGYQTHRIARKGGEPIRFASVDYEGALTVEDAEVFRTALAHGVGKAKAFGCGLLLIRPL